MRASDSRVQSEFSLWSRDVEENGVRDVARTRIALVPFSRWRGFLSGELHSADDCRRTTSGERCALFADNFAKNLEIVARVRTIADAKDATPLRLRLLGIGARTRIPFQARRALTPRENAAP